MHVLDCWHAVLNFIELLSTTICFAWNFFHDKNRITSQISICCMLFLTGIQLLFACPKFTWKFGWHSCSFQERNFMLSNFLFSSAMKLGPGDIARSHGTLFADEDREKTPLFIVYLQGWGINTRSDSSGTKQTLVLSLREQNCFSINKKKSNMLEGSQWKS